MEEKQIAEGALGSVGKYDFDFKNGELCLELTAVAGPGSAAIVVKLDAGKVLDAIAAKIPGAIDDAVLGMAKAALLGK